MAGRGYFHGADLPVHPDDPDVRRRAALYVAGIARDTDDARHLLDALGLLEPPAPARRKKTAPPTTTTTDCPINTRRGDS
ncbi:MULTISPECIES: hypothetical protein [unclassified Streptomyces]|uniref:hypothetical protein n=1 Tax=unclassified Streptomyces TaxID=2593676 RepID=UPI000DD84D8D|nr:MULTISPECIES: hypothetical protein [unclassified Streptomyces]QZZ26571.1 hypothetical protein A7X85_10150 [Streptomyces sp. ST1015]